MKRTKTLTKVVNALLTQIDKLKYRKNVLVMSTSNLVKAIDSAFIDRADILQYVDLPSREATYEILRTSLLEMITKGIVASTNIPTLKQAQMHERTINPPSTGQSQMKTSNVALKMLALAAQCKAQKLSGRALRRLPVLALSQFMPIADVYSFKTSEQSSGSRLTTGSPDIESWLKSMEKVVKSQERELERLT